MRTVRWISVSIVLPLACALAAYFAMRRPKPVYEFAEPTVLTVSDKPGPVIFHAPDPIYPPEARRDRVEGFVKLKVTIAADGTVYDAVPLSGPKPLYDAALANIRQYQFEAKPAETEIDIAFSLRSAVHAETPPQPLARTAPVYPKIARRRRVQGVVRVVALVDPEGKVESVQPVSGPEPLKDAALDAVRLWKFRPLLRDGKPGHGTAVIDVPFAL
jgi:TonB family protein